MTSQERLVKHIREFLNSPGNEMDASVFEMAQQFAEETQSANDRLDKCLEFLKHGRRSEAVQEATSHPSLFDLVETLNFPELGKWRNICEDENLPYPPDLNIRALDQLKEECSTEEFLEPLLRKYRRLVHQNNRDEQIMVLRQIREFDNENPVWEENLEPLEREQLDELAGQAKDAIEKKDFAELKLLYNDLTDPRRIVHPPPGLLQEVDDVLEEYRTEEAREAADKLSSEIKEATEAEDLERTSKLLEDWEALKTEHDFKPAPELEDIATKARAWVDAENEERERNQRFEQAKTDLNQALTDGDAAPQALVEKWNHLRSFNRDLPKELERAYSIRIAYLQQRIRNRYLFRIGTVLTIIMVVAVSSYFLITSIRQKKLREQRLEKLLTAWNQHRVPQVEQLLDKIEKEQPEFFDSQDVQKYVSRIENLEQAEAERLADLENVQDQLERIKRQEYEASDSQITQLLQRAQSLAATDRERQQFKRWKQQWEAYKKAQQEAVNERFQELVGDIPTQIESFLNSDANRQVAMERAIIKQYRKQLKEAKALRDDVSRSVQSRIETLEEKLLTWENKLDRVEQERAAVAEKQETLLNNITANLQSIESYTDHLQTYIENFPDTEEATSFNRAINMTPMYQDALRLQDKALPDRPIDATELAAMEELLNQLPADSPTLWREDLESSIAYQKQLREIDEKITKKLESFPFYTLKRLEITNKESGDSNTLYFVNEIRSKVETLADGEEVMLYWGQFFDPDSDLLDPQLEHKKFRTDTHELEIPDNQLQLLVPSAQFVREFIAGKPETPFIDNYIATAIDQLLKNKNIAPMPKGQLLKVFINSLNSLGMQLENGLANLQDGLQRLSLDLFWVNREHQRIKETEKALRELFNADLPNFTELVKQREALHELRLRSLDREIAFAGVVIKKDDGQLEPECTLGNVQQLWMVVPTTENGQYHLAKAYEKDETGFKPTSSAEEHAFYGLPLLTPQDGKTNQAFLKDVLGKTEITERPACWVRDGQ